MKSVTAAIPRKQAIERVNALAGEIVLHLIKIKGWPNDPSQPHWRGEVVNWIAMCYEDNLANTKGGKFTVQLAVAETYGHLFPRALDPKSRMASLEHRVEIEPPRRKLAYHTTAQDIKSIITSLFEACLLPGILTSHLYNTLFRWAPGR